MLRTNLPLILLFALLAGNASCELMGSEDTSATVGRGGLSTESSLTLVNETASGLWVLAMDRELSYLVDLNDTFPVQPGDERIVEARSTASQPWSSVDGYRPGRDIVCFVYVLAGAPGSVRTAHLRRALHVSAASLQASGSRIVIESL